jgi:hypothetical protein
VDGEQAKRAAPLSNILIFLAKLLVVNFFAPTASRAETACRKCVIVPS